MGEDDQSTPIIVGINGSLAKDGPAAVNLKKTLSFVKKHGAKTSLLHLIDLDIFPKKEYAAKKFQRLANPPYVNRDTVALYDILLGADGFILSTSVHWRMPCSLTVALFEKFNILEEEALLEGKVAGLIVNYGFEEGGVGNTLCAALLDMGVIVPPYGRINCGLISNTLNRLGPVEKLILKFVPSISKELDGTSGRLEALAQNVLAQIEILRRAGANKKRFWK